MNYMSHHRCLRLPALAVCALLWLACCSPLLSQTPSPSPANTGQAPSPVLDRRPVVGRNADGYLEVFRVDPAGVLRHRWQQKSNGNWSRWSGIYTPRPADERLRFHPAIALASNSRGELVLLAIEQGQNSLWLSRQKEAGSLEWTPWARLGDGLRTPIAAIQDSSGRLQVFARSQNNGAVLHLSLTNTDNVGTWSNLGGDASAALAVATNRDGRLELFAMASPTGPLRHCWQRPPADADDWSSWADLAGNIRPGFAIGLNARGILEVFGVNATNAAVQRLCQASSSNSLEWKPWENFGGPAQDGLAAGRSGDGRIELMAVRSNDSMLLHRWELLTDGSDKWSAWGSLGQPARPYPAVGQNEDGNLELFAVDPQNPETLNHRRQISRASDWLDWSTLEQAPLDYACRSWQTDEGLPHNQVLALAQTRDGYLWVGTRAGLARFDGLSFTTFDSANTPQIRNSSISALCAARDGALWIGTEGGGLASYRDGTFAHYGPAEGLTGDVVKCIYQTRDGALWLGTTNGLACFRDGKFTSYTREQGLSSDLVTYVHEDRDGFLWIATGQGLNRLKDGKMEAFPMPNGLPNDSVRVICQDRAGRIWIGSNNGMLWYNSYWRSFYAYNTKYGLSDSFVSAICDDREGNLWVGTYSGLNRYHEGRFFPEFNHEGAPFDRVNALLEDRDGNLWVGSREGLARLNPKRFFTYTKQEGLSHNNVMSVLEDPAGALWLGTWGGGLNRLQDERFTTFTITNDVSQNLVLGLGFTRDGSLWLGADFDGGLTRFKNGHFTHYTWRDGLPRGPVRVLLEDSSTNLWVGTAEGLCRFHNGTFTTCGAADGLAGSAIRALCLDLSGNLWVGAEGGLSRLRDGRFTSFTVADGLPDNTITALLADPDGSLWIGTRSGGLARFHNGRFTAYSTQQGLFTDEILDLVADSQGWLWMTCSKGVFRVRKQEFNDLAEGLVDSLSCTVYGKGDGFESVQCNGAAKPGACRSRDGRLWFPTTKGLVVVDPASLEVNPLPPPVFIETILADRKPVTFLARHGTASEPAQMGLASARGSQPGLPIPGIPHPAVLRLPPGRGELEFHFTALSLRAPESLRFKYKLEGLDSDWLDAGTRRVAHYNNIYPGNYRFRVIACGRDGVWNSTGASLDVILRPHVWETWWWRGSLALVCLGAVGGLARYFTRRRMQRKLAALEQRHAIEKERGRIAKDIHDDLGSSLTRIMMLGERAEEGLARHEEVAVHVEKIVASARASVQAMDEIVWAVNPENDTLEGLVEYLSHYADELFQDTPVSCRLEIPVQLPTCTLPAEVRHDLFLVVKEAFHNVLKHAHASEVRVRVSAAAGQLELSLQDNGRGFAPGAPHQGRHGNGLGNMAKRVEAHAGSFSLQSAPGQGTQIVLTIPLPVNAV